MTILFSLIFPLCPDYPMTSPMSNPHADTESTSGTPFLPPTGEAQAPTPQAHTKPRHAAGSISNGIRERV